MTGGGGVGHAAESECPRYGEEEETPDPSCSGVRREWVRENDRAVIKEVGEVGG